MIEIKKDGKTILTIEGVGGVSDDVVAVIRNSTISTRAFDDLFEKYVTQTETHIQAYERVETLHENLLGRRKYADFDNYKSSRSHRRK